MKADRITGAGVVAASSLAGAAVVLLLGAGPAGGQRMENGIAVFAALDKVTARISKLEVKLNETMRFGALKVTPRVCYSRAPTEQPKTSTFIEVDEVLLDGKERRIFSGWMFAESPALNPLEHPVYDIWLTECSAPLRAPPGVGERAPQRGRPGAAPPSPTAPATANPPAPPAEPPPGEEFRRRRPR